MERILTGLAIANPRMTASNYIGYLRRLSVVVKVGAQKILAAMPDSCDLEKRVQVVEARCAPGDGEAVSLVDIAEVLSQEFGCGVIAAHLVPVTCIEILQLWQRTGEFRHIIIFHQPIEVNNVPSLLHFQRIDDDIVLTHTDALGNWNAPETLFVACMPVVTPTRRLITERTGEPVPDDSCAVLA